MKNVASLLSECNHSIRLEEEEEEEGEEIRFQCLVLRSKAEAKRQPKLNLKKIAICY